MEKMKRPSREELKQLLHDEEIAEWRKEAKKIRQKERAKKKRDEKKEEKWPLINTAIPIAPSKRNGETASSEISKL